VREILGILTGREVWIYEQASFQIGHGSGVGAAPRYGRDAEQRVSLSPFSSAGKQFTTGKKARKSVSDGEKQRK
jgi:hypothetical protein